MKQVFAAFARNRVLANVSVCMILFAGLLAAMFMVREDLPQMAEDAVSIHAAWPGADPGEVEEGICRKIEEAARGVEGVKKWGSLARENEGSVWLEIKEGYDPNQVLEDVRNRVNAISTFPRDAEKPIVIRPMHREAVMGLYLQADMPEHRLKEWANEIEDEMRRDLGVSFVQIVGARDYEIDIEVSEERLRQFGISLSRVADAVRKSNLNLSGGSIHCRGEEIRLGAGERKYTGEELASIVVLAGPDGESTTLDRLAVIDDGFEEGALKTGVNGAPAILLNVFKTPREDAIAISESVRRFVAEKRRTLPEGSVLEILFDNTDATRARIDILVKNGVIGLLIVFALLWIFLDARLSFWVGMGIPISLLGGVAVTWAAGGTLNMVSLFSLILVLGIVADDAIVVGEAIFARRKKGDPPLEAAVNGIAEVGMPVAAAVFTSMAAFLPLAFLPGMMGKFIAILPITVIACLGVSLVESLFMLPAHLSHVPAPGVGGRLRFPGAGMADRLHGAMADGLERFTVRVYRPLLARALRRRWTWLCFSVSVLLLTLGLVQGGIVKFDLFPEMDGFVISSAVEFPEGTPWEETEKAVKALRAALERIGDRHATRSGDPMIVDVVTMVGIVPDDDIGEFEDLSPSSHLGGVQAVLLESEKRGFHTRDILAAWEKEAGAIPGARATTFSSSGVGPPGEPIEIGVEGDDMEEILAAARVLMDRLGRYQGVYQIRTDHSPGKNEIHFRLKPEARTLGLTVEDLARQVHAGYYGEEALRIQRGRDEIRIRVRYTFDERSRMSSLAKVRVRTPDGRSIPLASAAHVDYGPGPGVIRRENGKRRVTVLADLDKASANTDEIINELAEGFFETLKNDHPGIDIVLEGDEEEEEESLGGLMIGFPLAALGIFLILAAMFRSYSQPLIILFTAPFGVIGAVVGHWLLGHDLSLLSVFGMVALTGVVVNDAIVLLERINKNLAAGAPLSEAVESGCVRRFRAVFLTSISTVGGLAPLIMEPSQHAQLLIPMAISMAAGVSLATILTLFLIPCLFLAFDDIRRFHQWVMGGKGEPQMKVS